MTQVAAEAIPPRVFVVQHANVNDRGALTSVGHLRYTIRTWPEIDVDKISRADLQPS
jgi:hypothetical protein